MATVTQRLQDNTGKPTFICDFTPPRGGDTELLAGSRQLAAGDFVAVAYNPGKLVRADSAAAAFRVREITGRDVIFNLSPRDMNRLALETRLLGAQMLGLENVLVLQGDSFTERDGLAAAGDYTATELIAAARNLNQGQDYRGAKLRSATSFCIGAALDLGRGVREEAELTRKKVEAGADFFVAQPVFDAADVSAFLEAYEAKAGSPLSAPVFWGLQILAQDGVLFSSVPGSVREQVEAGRDGVEIALELYEGLREAGIDAIYLVAPILKGGARDYDAAARLLEQIGSGA